MEALLLFRVAGQKLSTALSADNTDDTAFPDQQNSDAKRISATYHLSQGRRGVDANMRHS